MLLHSKIKNLENAGKGLFPGRANDVPGNGESGHLSWEGNHSIWERGILEKDKTTALFSLIKPEK